MFNHVYDGSEYKPKEGEAQAAKVLESYIAQIQTKFGEIGGKYAQKEQNMKAVDSLVKSNFDDGWKS